MKVVNMYPTKAKWSLFTDPKTGVGLVGYDSLWGYRSHGMEQPKGMNQLLHGTIMMTGFSRGRSAANFNFYDELGRFFDCGMQGAYNLFEGASKGSIDLGHATWPAEDMPEGRSGPTFTGYWTFAKRGTQVFITPAEENIVQLYR